uniref:DUF3668 domain-containing protein n=5 Tax=Lygus hesperus TaxID=30085 RepID=A0A0A9X7I2_LYGHE
MMDNLLSSSLQVVLEIKEGSGFSFLTSPLIVVAALNGSKLESAEIRPASSPLFDTQLLWQTDKKYLRRLRTGNTALKIECFSVINEHKRDRLGYILLNLKEAQIIPKDSGIAALETWHKLLGLRSEAKSHAPELLLRFKIEEANDESAITKPSRFASIKDYRDNRGMGDAAVHLSGPHFLQIGPPESTELYELVINIQEAGNLYSVIPPSEIGAPITFQYSVMGSSYISDDFNGLQDTVANAMAVVEVKSQAAFLASYFKGFPHLTFKLYCGDKILGSASIDLQELSKFSNSKPFVKKSKIFIKTLDGKDVTEAESLNPYLKVEVSLLPKNVNLYEDNVKKMLEAPRLDAGDAPFPSRNTFTQEFQMDPLSPPPPNRVMAHLDEPEHDILSDDLLLPHEDGFMFHNDSISKQELSENDSKVRDLHGRREDVIGSPHHATVNSGKPNQLNAQTKSNFRADILPRQYIREAAQKTCEELEDWKEQQQEIFKYELKMKTEKHLKKLSEEWIKQKKDLETTLKEKIDNCQNLYRKLEEAISDLVVKSERLSLKEDELHRAKEELDRKYTTKFQELRKASQLHQFDMEQKIHAVVVEKNSLTSKLEERDREIAHLKETIAKNSSDLSKDQVAALIEDMRQLEQNLHKALQSKAFFKEQWAKVLRELHMLKEQEQQEMKCIIQKNKDELASVGLVQGITDEVDEMRRDQLELLKLKEEIKSKVSIPTESQASSRFD